MGYSAGALIFGPDLTLMNHVDSLLGFNEMGLRERDCIGLYDFHIFPHFKDFTSQVPELSHEITAFESQADDPVYRINDNQAILYNNEGPKLIGN